MPQPKNITIGRNFLTTALALTISGILFTGIAIEFNNGKSIENALIAKEKAFADDQCKEYNDQLFAELGVLRSTCQDYKDVTTENTRHLRAQVEEQRHQIGLYYAVQISNKKLIKEQQEIIKRFKLPKSYQEVWDLYHEAVQDMPDPVVEE